MCGERYHELGTHHMFIAEVVGVSIDDTYMNEENAFSFSKARPLVYSHGHYFGLGKMIGKFGWSVQKKKKSKTRNKKSILKIDSFQRLKTDL
jgi:hypothetical protein